MRLQTVGIGFGCLGLAASLALGCHAPETAEEAEARAKREESEQVVARIDGEPRTLGQVQLAIEEQPAFARQGIQGKAGYQRFFAEFLNFELLAREGRARGLADDPRVLRATQARAVELYWSDPRWWGDGDELEDAEVSAFYEANGEAYRAPSTVELRWVEFRDPGLAAAAHAATRAAAGLARGAGVEPLSPMALLEAVALPDALIDESIARDRTPVEARSIAIGNTDDPALSALAESAQHAPIGLLGLHRVADGPGFVYVTRAAKPGEVPPLARVRHLVVQDILLQRRDLERSAAENRLVEAAEIEILDPELSGARALLNPGP